MNSFLNKLKPGGKKKSGSSAATPPKILGSDIGQPFEVKHHIHCNYDRSTGKIVGLPPAWIKLLETSNISNSEQSENPEALIDVLNFYSESMNKSSNKFIATQETINKHIHDTNFVHLGKTPVKTDNESSDGSFISSSEDLIGEIVPNDEQQSQQPSPQKIIPTHQQPTHHTTTHQPSDHQNNVCPPRPETNEKRENVDEPTTIQNNVSKKDVSKNEKKDLRDLTASLDRVIGEAENLLLSFDVNKVHIFTILLSFVYFLIVLMDSTLLRMKRLKFSSLDRTNMQSPRSNRTRKSPRVLHQFLVMIV